jgi:hypothetical protein
MPRSAAFIFSIGEKFRLGGLLLLQDFSIKPFRLPLALSFLASTFRHETVLKETAFAFRLDCFEYSLDGEKRLFACSDRAAKVSPHLDKS